MENIKRLSTSSERSECFFYRTASGTEVDLIIERNRIVEAYEIKFAKTISKEGARSLQIFINEHKTKIASLLSLQEQTIPLFEGITATHWNQQWPS